MKKLNQMEEGKFLKYFFLILSLCFLVTAVILGGPRQLYTGMVYILLLPCKVTTNYFALGGFAATFLNMGLVGLICWGLCHLPGAKVNNVTTLGFLLTLGFASWGINPLNIIPTILGVLLFCLVKKEKAGSQVNAMLFSTGIAPLISDLLFRYPGTTYTGLFLENGSLNFLGLGLALLVGLVIGFFLPAGLGHAPNIHKGFNHYSAAVPIGFTAFFLRVVLYKVLLGKSIGDMGELTAYNPAGVGEAFWLCNIFCAVIFVACIVVALLMGGSFRDYGKLLKDTGKGVNFAEKYGKPAFLMNVGFYGLMIVAYFNLAAFLDGGTARMSNVWTGITFGIVFCMLCTCNSGSHPGNVWPIMAGYILTSFLFGWFSGLLGVEKYSLTIGSQAILIGMCYANGLSPISGTYGFGYGILAGGLHYLLVTAVPDMHGGFCLYNGGFTAALICLMLVPQLEKFCKTKEERALAKAEKANK